MLRKSSLIVFLHDTIKKRSGDLRGLEMAYQTTVTHKPRFVTQEGKMRESHTQTHTKSYKGLYYRDEIN